MQMKKPLTEVLLKHKEHQHIEEFADTLEAIAGKLRQDGQFTFIQGTKHVSISPSDQIKVNFEYVMKADKHVFEIKFEWLEGPRGYSKMGIE